MTPREELASMAKLARDDARRLVELSDDLDRIAAVGKDAVVAVALKIARHVAPSAVPQ